METSYFKMESQKRRMEEFKKVSSQYAIKFSTEKDIDEGLPVLMEYGFGGIREDIYLVPGWALKTLDYLGVNYTAFIWANDKESEIVQKLKGVKC